MPSSQTPSMKKVERRKICQFRCLCLKGNNNSQQVTPQDCQSQGAGKAVPPLTEGTTLKSSTEGTTNSHWTPQAQKKFLSFHLAQQQILPFSSEGKKNKNKRPQKSARGCQVFLFQMPPSSVFIPRCPELNPHLITLYLIHSGWVLWLQIPAHFHSCCTAAPQHPASTTLPAVYHTL